VAWVVGVAPVSLPPEQSVHHIPIVRSSLETNDSPSYLALQTINQQIRRGLHDLSGVQGSFRSDAQELVTRLALARDQDLIVITSHRCGEIWALISHPSGGSSTQANPIPSKIITKRRDGSLETGRLNMPYPSPRQTSHKNTSRTAATPQQGTP
jgi:hypothetical protein